MKTPAAALSKNANPTVAEAVVEDLNSSSVAHHPVVIQAAAVVRVHDRAGSVGVRIAEGEVGGRGVGHLGGGYSGVVGANGVDYAGGGYYDYGLCYDYGYGGGDEYGDDAAGAGVADDADVELLVAVRPARRSSCGSGPTHCLVQPHRYSPSG